MSMLILHPREKGCLASDRGDDHTALSCRRVGGPAYRHYTIPYYARHYVRHYVRFYVRHYLVHISLSPDMCRLLAY